MEALMGQHERTRQILEAARQRAARTRMGDQEEQPPDAGQEDPGEANAHDSNQDGMEEDRPVEALNHPGPRGSRKVNHHGAGEEMREEEEDRGSGDIVRELMLLGVGRDEAMAHAQYLRDYAARVAEAGGGIQAVERLAVAEVFRRRE